MQTTAATLVEVTAFAGCIRPCFGLSELLDSGQSAAAMFALDGCNKYLLCTVWTLLGLLYWCWRCSGRECDYWLRLFECPYKRDNPAD